MIDQHNPRAFPSAAIDDRFGGMGLWDFYAAHTLSGMWAAIGVGEIEPDSPDIKAEVIAEAAGIMADAMLAERAKRFPQPERPIA